MKALALALLAAATASTPLPPPALTVPAGYGATATWDAVTTDVTGAPLAGVSYKFYNIKNGVNGYLGSTTLTMFKWTVNVPQCVFVTALVYQAGKPVESKGSTPFCIAIASP